MEKLDKILRKFSPKERETIEHLIEKVLARDISGIDVKKLKGLKNLFRVRKENIRIIFELSDGKEPSIMSIERKSETTYRF